MHTDSSLGSLGLFVLKKPVNHEWTRRGTNHAALDASAGSTVEAVLEHRGLFTADFANGADGGNGLKVSLNLPAFLFF